MEKENYEKQPLECPTMSSLLPETTLLFKIRANQLKTMFTETKQKENIHHRFTQNLKSI